MYVIGKKQESERGKKRGINYVQIICDELHTRNGQTSGF